MNDKPLSEKQMNFPEEYDDGETYVLTKDVRQCFKDILEDYTLQMQEKTIYK